MARITPIVYPSNGLGLRNAAETALVKHRSRGITQPKVEKSNGRSGPGVAAPGATINLKGSSV